jgi:hypothetical protein
MWQPGSSLAPLRSVLVSPSNPGTAWGSKGRLNLYSTAMDRIPKSAPIWGGELVGGTWGTRSSVTNDATEKEELTLRPHWSLGWSTPTPRGVGLMSRGATGEAAPLVSSAARMTGSGLGQTGCVVGNGIGPRGCGRLGWLGEFGPASGLFHPFSFLFLFLFLISNPIQTMFKF